MTAIAHTSPPPDDVRLVSARRVLAELPDVSNITNPWYWIGRLSASLAALAAGWPSGVPGGLSGEHREVLAAALADAAEYREARAGDSFCADCQADPSLLCSDHAADFDLSSAYVTLAAELELELSR